MLPLIVLFVGVMCAMLSRIMIFLPALNISWGWAVGVWLPFGPLFFRRSFPNEARPSTGFRVAGLLLILLSIGLASRTGMNLGFLLRTYANRASFSIHQPNGFAMERPAEQHTPTLEERRAANAKELERLAKWNAELRLKKRDLLRSDIEGNRAYDAELARYNAELAKATSEKNELSGPAAKH